MFIGCQFSLYAMTDNFVDVILGAVESLKSGDDLRVEADDLSTLVVGRTDRIFAAVHKAFQDAAATGKHVVANLTFSRGCPGEPDDPICTPEDPEESEAAPPDPRTATATGTEAAAQFAVYPLGSPDYMNAIGDEIEKAKEAGTFTGGKHFCTRLDADSGPLFATLQAAFENAGKTTGHVVVTATVSANSPSARSGIER